MTPTLLPRGARIGVGAAAVAVTGVVAGAAGAHDPTRTHVRDYERSYHQVAHALGPQAPGRNILRDGVAGRRRVTDAELVSSLSVLERMIGAGGSSAETGGSAAGAAGVPTCASESGSDYATGASNTNASSGATGRYQILPSTAAAYGCSLATPAGQDACAQTIYEHQGAAAWVGCGG